MVNPIRRWGIAMQILQKSFLILSNRNVFDAVSDVMLVVNMVNAQTAKSFVLVEEGLL